MLFRSRKAKGSDNWFVGGVTGMKARQSTVKLDFLEKGREVADALIGALLEEKGYGEEAMHSMDYHAYKEKQYQILANAVRENVDMKKIYEIIEKGNAAECFI